MYVKIVLKNKNFLKVKSWICILKKEQILKSLNVAQISLLISTIVYQKVLPQKFQYFLYNLKYKKSFPIGAHTNTGVRIYWNPRKKAEFIELLVL